MQMTFKIKNVKCGGCANTLTKKLEPEYGKIVVNLEVEPREITLNIDQKNIENLKNELRKLGYPFIDDELNSFQTVSSKAKSFVSCAIGKIDS